MGCINISQYDPNIHEIISVHNTEAQCNEECGVCCVNGVCIDNNQTDCTNANGIWYGGVTCEDVICPSVSPSPSFSVTPTPSPSFSVTPTPSPSVPVTLSPSVEPSASPSPSVSLAPEVGVCCIPQCDEFCNYCESYVFAAKAHGTYVVTGDVTVTYTDPGNLCDPWHGGPFIGNSGPPGTDTTSFSHTYTINGTYTWDGGSSYYWSNNSDDRVFIDGSQGWDTLGVWIDSPNSYGWPIIGNIHIDGANSWYGPYGYGGMSWEPNCGPEFDWGDFTVNSSVDGVYVYYPSTIDPETGQCVPDYESPSPFPPGLTITGSTINIKFIPSTENQSVCENAGGLFFGTDLAWNFTPNPDQAMDSCLFQTYATGLLVEECPPPIQLGGNYFDVNDPFSAYGNSPYITNINPGTCCEGICSPNLIKDDTLVYCTTSNNCLNFSAVPNTSGCNDTITQSACVQGGVYSPEGVAIGTWYPGENCATFSCSFE